jgi:hypothetical protein
MKANRTTKALLLLLLMEAIRKKKRNGLFKAKICYKRKKKKELDGNTRKTKINIPNLRSEFQTLPTLRSTFLNSCFVLFLFSCLFVLFRCYKKENKTKKEKNVFCIILTIKTICRFFFRMNQKKISYHRPSANFSVVNFSRKKKRYQILLGSGSSSVKKFRICPKKKEGREGKKITRLSENSQNFQNIPKEQATIEENLLLPLTVGLL